MSTADKTYITECSEFCYSPRQKGFLFAESEAMVAAPGSVSVAWGQNVEMLVQQQLGLTEHSKQAAAMWSFD